MSLHVIYDIDSIYLLELFLQLYFKYIIYSSVFIFYTGIWCLLKFKIMCENILKKCNILRIDKQIF